MKIIRKMAGAAFSAVSALAVLSGAGVCEAQAQTTWTLSASVSGGGGTINSPTSKTVANGSYASISVTPNPGYHLDTVAFCGSWANGYTNTVISGPVTANCNMSVTFAPNSASKFTGPFKHPGILLNLAQLDYIKQQANANVAPWSTAFNNAKASAYGSLTYAPSPRSVVDDNVAASETAVKNDSLAAYTQALLWYVTGNTAYANKAVAIMNGWSSTLTGGFITTRNPANWTYRIDATLAAQNFTRAAEIIRATYASGWAAADIASFQNMLTTQFLPAIPDGQMQGNYAGYYNISMAEARMNIGVFNEDLTAFNLGLDAWRRALPAYIYMASDGATPGCPANWSTSYCTSARLLSLWFNGKTPTPAYANGLTQDTYFNNMQGVGYGLAGLEQAAETAYQQGIDLWSENTLGTVNAQRLAAALELNTGYISQCGATGTTCPTNITAGYTSASTRVGALEIAYNHLANRLSDFSLPNTAAYLASARPTGSYNTSIGWQTLTHYGQGLRGFPDFSFTPPPTALSVPPGGSNNMTVTLASSLGFSAPVNLTVSGLPAGVTASFAQGSVTPDANGTAAVTLTVAADASAALGTTTVTISGTTGSTTHTTHTATFSLTVSPKVNGTCGSDNGQVLLSPPNNLCNSGTASAVSGNGHPWNWSCSGASGGTNATCSATRQTWSVSTMGSAGGAISAPASASVDNGMSTTFTVSVNSGYTIASLTGSGCTPSLMSGDPYLGGTYTTGAVNTNCVISATFSTSAVNGVCGSDNGQVLLAAPSANLCSAGTAGAVGGNGHPWNWSCSGVNGGATAVCAATIQGWTVSTSVSGVGGTISAPANANVDNGSATTFTVTADAGYSIDTVGGSGCSPTLVGGAYTTGALAANCAITASFRADDNVDRLRKAWVNTITGASNDMSDIDIASAVNSNASAAATSANTMDQTGASGCLWSGTTYCDWTKSATITSNFTRLKSMASAWAQPGGAKQGDPALLQAIIYGLDWMNSRYYNSTSAGTVSGTNNWWDWQIGTPKELGQAAMLIYPKLTASQIANYTAAIDHFVPTPTSKVVSGAPNMTGANLADQIFGVLASGVLNRNSVKIALARDAMSPLFLYSTAGDGYYADGSFVQHTNVAYTGSYGAVELDDDAALIQLFNNSAWPITDLNQVNVFTRAMQSYAPLIYNGAMMDMVMGRAVSRSGAWDHFNGRAVIVSLAQLAQGAPADQKAAIQSFIKGQLARDTVFSNYQNLGKVYSSYFQGLAAPDIANLKALLADTSLPTAAPMTASYNFASMARVAHLRPGFAFGLAMFSPKITAYEFGNNENLKAWYTGAGTTYLYNEDQTQFDSNFWPTVNPLRLPGVTTDGASKTPTTAWAMVPNPNNWVGGSTVNGLYTSAGMKFSMVNDTNSSLSGYKSWFLFDNKMVALGAGISGGGVVETIVENRRINAAGDNVLVVNGTAQPTALGAAPLADVSWAWLDGNVANSGIGYYFPTPVGVNALRETLGGSWSALNGGGSTTSYTNNFLSLALAHGTAPTDAGYAYVVLPNQTQDSMASYAAAPDIRVLANTTAVQAVMDTSINAVGANFWTNTATTVNDQNGVAYLTSAQQASVTTLQTGDVLDVAVSDPTQANTGTITITINRIANAVIAADPQVTVVQSSPTIVLRVAVNGSAGKSYSVKLNAPSAPDFNVALASTSVNLTQGGSGSNAVTVNNLNGVVATETLSISGLPAGVTASFSPASVNPAAGGSATSTLSINAASNAALGAADVTVIATSGSTTRTSTFTLNVSPAPDFNISTALAGLSVQQGANGSVATIVSSLNGFNSAANLSVSGLPGGVTASFAPASVTPAANGSATSNLVLTVGSSAAIGTSNITVTSTSGAINHSTTFDLTVTPGQDFSVSTAASNVSVQQNSSGSAATTVTSLYGFNSAANLSVSGLPAGVTAAFSPASVTPQAGGSASSNLVLTVSSSAAVGSSTITVTSTSGAISHSTTFDLTVTPGQDFSVSIAPSSVSVQQNSSGSVVTTVASLYGFNSAASLSVSGLPAGVTAAFSPDSVNPAADGSATSNLVLTVSSSAAVGSSTITVTSTSGAISHSATFNLTITPGQDFNVSIAPSNLSVQQGASGSAPTAVTSQYGFNSAVNLSVSGLPAGVTAAFSPASVSPAADGSATSNLVLTVASSAMVGSSTITVTSTSGAISHSATFNLTITPGQDFGVSIAPSSVSVQQGASGSAPTTVTSLYGFSSAVNLSVSGLPAGVTAAFSPASVNPAADGSATSNLVLTVSSSAAVGSSTITVTSTSGAISHSATINLTITPGQDFSVSTTPSVSAQQNSRGSAITTVTSQYGFNSAVNLSVSGLPAGVTAAFSPASVTPVVDGSVTSNLVLTVASSAAVGSSTITVISTSGAISHSATFNLTITPGQDFSVGTTPNVSVQQNSSGSVATTVTSLYGFNSAVNLSVSGLPAGVTASFSPAALTPSAGGSAMSNLVLTVSPSAAVGTSTITVTSTSGTTTHSTSFDLTVTAAPPSDFGLAVGQSTLTVARGKSGNLTADVSGLGVMGPGAVALSVSGLPPGVSATFSPASVTPSGSGSASSLMTLNVNSKTETGTVIVTVTGASNAYAHSATFSLIIKNK